jgi:hypothetical protein
MDNLEKYKSSHSEFFAKNKKLRIAGHLLFSTLNDLWWEKWRYNYGANEEIYKTADFPATCEQPNSPTFAPATITRQKPIENVLTPTMIPLKTPSVSSIGSSKGTICQTTALTVKPTSMAKVVDSHFSLSTPKKHTRALIYMEIAAVIVGTAAAIGYLSLKKHKKRPKVVS